MTWNHRIDSWGLPMQLLNFTDKGSGFLGDKNRLSQPSSKGKANARGLTEHPRQVANPCFLCHHFNQQLPPATVCQVQTLTLSRGRGVQGVAKQTYQECSNLGLPPACVPPSLSALVQGQKRRPTQCKQQS